jgi:hypothetical protein
MTSCGKGRKIYWQQRLLGALPPEQSFIERNAAITAQYAKWYIGHREIFKWAGVAAFASHRVRLILSLPLQQPPTPNITVNQEVFLHDWHLIRQTNNEVFADIGWAHLAYASSDGGLSAIEAALADEPNSTMMLEGFRAIDLGRKELADPSPSRQYLARARIWFGNCLLLEHEQLNAVQPNFARLQTCGLKRSVSQMTDMDFDVDDDHADQFTYSSFRQYLQAQGVHSPDIAEFEQRWRWIEGAVAPTWKRVDAQDRRLIERMSRMINECAGY